MKNILISTFLITLIITNGNAGTCNSPDDTLATLPAAVSGVISPDGTQYFYFVEVTQGGMLIADIPVSNGLNLVVSIYRVNPDPGFPCLSQDLVAQKSGTTPKTVAVVPPGKYKIKVEENGNNDSETDPFNMYVSFDITDASEYNHTFLAADTNASSQYILNGGQTITFPAKIYGENRTEITDIDVDYYKVTTMKDGVLEVKITNAAGAALGLQATGYLGDMSTIVGTKNSPLNGSDFTLPLVICAGTYYVRINENGNNDTDPDAFTVTFHLDDTDTAECNHIAADAFEITLNGGDTKIYDGQIYGINADNPISNDQDWYKIITTTDGVLETKITNAAATDLSLQVEGFLDDGVTSIGYEATNQGANGTLPLVMPAGTYYIRINENGNNDYDEDPFTLTFHLDVTDGCEYNNHFSSSCPITLNNNQTIVFPGQIYGIYTPNPVDNDRDYYAVNVVQSGNVMFQISNASFANLFLHLNSFESDTVTALLNGSDQSNQGGNAEVNVEVCAGLYYFRINENGDNHSSPLAYTITIAHTPSTSQSPIISASGPLTFCDGQSVTLTSSAASNYLWSTGATTQSIVVSVANDYWVSTIATNNCIYVSDTITTNVNQVPSANAGTDTTICEGNLTTLTASGGDTYQWSTSDTTASFSDSPLLTTTYSVTVTANGCSASDEVTVIVNPLPIADAGNDVAINSGSSTQLIATGGIAYSWMPANSLDNPNIANPVASPSTSTTYTVTVTDLNGCTNTDEVIVDVLTGIEDIHSSILNIYPNPVSSQFFIESSENISSILIHDLLGKELLRMEELNDQNISVSLKGISSGVYLVKIKTDEGEVVKKIVVE